MADSPKQAEAAQALFSAIVDYLGKPIPMLENYNKFKKEYKTIFIFNYRFFYPIFNYCINISRFRLVGSINS